MSVSKKHMEWAASYLAGNLAPEGIEDSITVQAFADFFEEFSPRFDKGRFLTAVVGRSGKRRNPRPSSRRQRQSPDDAYPDLGKFEGEKMLAVEMYESAMESGADEEGGDSTDGPGYFWLFTDFTASDGTLRHGILSESGQGFISLTEYDTPTDAHETWEQEIEPILNEMGSEGQ